MKSKLQSIKEESAASSTRILGSLQTALDHTEQIADEYHRVTEYSKSPAVIINEIDSQFESATRLSKTDIAFLFVATALQCVRQYVLTPFTERVNDQEAAKAVKEHEEHSNRSHRHYNPSLQEIITNPVPFDTALGSGKGRKFEGALSDFGYLGHRGATPGHDPVLGLVFGTANIATSTLTNWRMESYHVYTGTVGKLKGNHDILNQHAQTPKVFAYTSDKLLHQGMEGKKIIGVSIMKEIQHLRSDVYSTMSLPLPIVSYIDPELAGELAKRGLDMANVLDVSRQFTYSCVIDALISFIHGLFYMNSAAENDISQDLYEVRTRRILVYSNLLASSSNVIVAALMTYIGADGKKVIDWGGYANTLRHIAFDSRFIHNVKKEFLRNGLNDRIVGAEYDFMKGDF